MNRRHFSRQLLSCVGGVAMGNMAAPHALLDRLTRQHGAFTAGHAADLLINGPRLLRNMQLLSQFGHTPEGGVNRVAYSQADIDARAFVRTQMEAAGLQTSVDAAGNLIGRASGRNANLPVIMTGSHIDSVPFGGSYDGNVGALAAVEVAHALHDAGQRTQHPLEVVIFPNEEDGKTGSQGMAGKLSPDVWKLPTASGHTVAEGTRLIGGNPDRIEDAKRHKGDIHAFVELHIEQGAILQERGIEIGIVEGIVGIRRWNVTVEGFANHAGTTPMNARKDALVGAARFVDAVNRVAREMPGRQVATVGRLLVEPGAPNVIPGKVTLSLEIRDLAMNKIDHVFNAIESEVARIAEATGTTFTLKPYYVSEAALSLPDIQDMVAAAAKELGHTTLRMPSGAGHDAQSIAAIAPIGMIFVPSKDGISHSPREFTQPDQMVKGANVLLRTLLRVDAAALRV